ncbi:hypothetical protein MDAP_002153 [Mitosporidium daphniae]|uniref:DUF8032 domain-containing protein n=1 Tax=Mitosporidium daphniae TaxID=1485682 RepID=A0A098VPC8_9MICR|nr:uncharacterized protein DI09_54p70 [Mitosporidium daphniae]KGG50815.1 hypothetical protein DI09_54p70 [Mitosporidium daphniae]|eukprot:XP_013237260.1 uncharacterized protein DI09_54p70 [Mitosporidium daphniae]
MIYSNTKTNHHIANNVPHISDEHIFSRAIVIPNHSNHVQIASDDGHSGWIDPSYHRYATAAHLPHQMAPQVSPQIPSAALGSHLPQTSLTPHAGSSEAMAKGAAQTTEDAHLSALALTRLLQGSAEEVLAFLSSEQLIELGRNVRKLKRLASTDAISKKRLLDRHVIPHSSRLQEAGGNALIETPDKLSMMINVATGGEYASCAGPSLLRFVYSSRGALQEYCIKADIDSIASDSLPESFKLKNCVYRRAMGDRSQYKGNRYEYETSVNDIAWRLTWINLDTLAGKRGLIQRAVDSYRNRFNVSRSRRVLRQEKLLNGTLRRRADSAPYVIANRAMHYEHQSHIQYSHAHDPALACAPQYAAPHSPHASYANPSPSCLFSDSPMQSPCPEDPAPWAKAAQPSSGEFDENFSDASIPAIFLSTISFYDARGMTATLKVRLDVDSIANDGHKDEGEKKSLDGETESVRYNAIIDCVDGIEETNKQSTLSLKDELGYLLARLNHPILASNASALRGAVDAFKYKVLTSDPLLFPSEIASRVSHLKERFGSLLAPVPSKTQHLYATGDRSSA